MPQEYVPIGLTDGDMEERKRDCILCKGIYVGPIGHSDCPFILQLCDDGDSAPGGKLLAIVAVLAIVAFLFRL